MAILSAKKQQVMVHTDVQDTLLVKDVNKLWVLRTLFTNNYIYVAEKNYDVKGVVHQIGVTTPMICQLPQPPSNI
jgi:hypothetical protein